MKKILAVTALAAFAVAGCSTSDDYGGSDARFSTPSWGTGSSVTPDDNGTAVSSPSPTQSGEQAPGESTDFGTQQ